MTYTLEAIRYGEWVTYTFTTMRGEVLVKPSWGRRERMSVEEARKFWKGLTRKGWKRQEEPVIEF